MLHSREKRIAEAIRQALTNALLYDVQDPRVPGILTITQVVVSKDFRHAKVWFSQIPDDRESVAETLDFFQSASGFLRRVVAKEVNVKFTPELEFAFDSSAQKFARVDKKLREIKEVDGREEEE